MKMRYTALAIAAAMVAGHGAWAGEAEAKKWIDTEFQPSTLSKDKQMAEMKWFIGIWTWRFYHKFLSFCLS